MYSLYCLAQYLHYIFWNNDTALLFAREVNSEINEVNSVITVAFNREIFSLELYGELF